MCPPAFVSPQFFYQFHNGIGYCQPIGINLIGKVSTDIANFLGLEDYASYTGHFLWRSSASWLADSDADKDMIMHHGGWNSSTVAEGYVETSVESKKRIAEHILGDQNPLNKVRKISHEESSSKFDITSYVVKLEHCS